MEIPKFDLHSQRNAAHYQFQTDFKSTIIKYTDGLFSVRTYRVID